MTVSDLIELNEYVTDLLGRKAWAQAIAARKGASFRKAYQNSRLDHLIACCIKQVCALNVQRKEDQTVVLPASLTEQEFIKFISFIKTSYVQ